MVQTGSVLQNFPVLETTELSLFCGHMSDSYPVLVTRYSHLLASSVS
jgi:hypothetical protein